MTQHNPVEKIQSIENQFPWKFIPSLGRMLTFVWGKKCISVKHLIYIFPYYFLSENAEEYLQIWYQWNCNAQSEIANYIVVGTVSKPKLFPPIASIESMK